MYQFLKGRLLLIRLILIAASALLILIGLLTIYAAQTANSSKINDLDGFWQKQAVFSLAAVLAFLVINFFHYRQLGHLSLWAYIFVLILLSLLLISKYVIPLPFAPPRNNSFRWIIFSIGSHELPAIQPSEICKLIYIIGLAWYLRYRSNYRSFKSLIGPFALTVLPMVLILKEPDLGTVLLMLPILFSMLFVAGAKIKHLVIITLLAILISPFLWLHIQDYQRLRISSMLLQSEWIRDKTEEHPKFAQFLGGKTKTYSTWERQWENEWGFQLIRSKYAIGSAGFTGFGFKQGPFLTNNFLPERHNDFIFATIAHQWGFLGSLGLIILYIIVILCGIEIASNNIDPFGRLIAVGIVAMFAVQVLVNIGMTLGIMPVTGLTLPLVSYGGSSLVISAAAIGLLNNIGRCRPFTVAPKSPLTIY